MSREGIAQIYRLKWGEELKENVWRKIAVCLSDMNELTTRPGVNSFQSILGGGTLQSNSFSSDSNLNSFFLQFHF